MSDTPGSAERATRRIRKTYLLRTGKANDSSLRQRMGRTATAALRALCGSFTDKEILYTLCTELSWSYIREEIEYTLSRNSDVIAYNSAPILKIAGGLKGSEDKGESRRVYRVEQNGDVSYVSWQQAIEALKYHVDTLLKLFWCQSQMPDISFENMKALGNIGYDARQTLLTDAHLKVGDESGAWIEFFERETSVVKAFLKEMNKAWASEVDNVEVEHIISPFIQNDEKAEIEKWVTANGGKAVVSQLEAIKNLGISSNPQETLEQIQKEDAAASVTRMNSLFEGAE